MPAQLQFLDMSVLTAMPPAPYEPIPVSVGSNFRPNDLRIFHQISLYTSGVAAAPQPPGYTQAFALTTSGNSADAKNVRADYKRLQPGDTNTFIQYATTVNVRTYSAGNFTVRGVDPTWTPTGAWAGLAGVVTNNAAPDTVVVLPSLSVPAAGSMVLWVFTSGSGTANTVGCPVGCPTGWTNLVASDKSGATYYPYSADNATMLVAKTFSAAGSTGSITMPYGAENGTLVAYLWMFFKAAPDSAATTGSATTTSTCTNATAGSSNNNSLPTGSAACTSTCTTAFNPLEGYWISDPLTLPGDPVTGSVIRWAGDVPDDASMQVLTSINNGASWDVARNNRPIPRLRAGDTSTRNVLTKVAMTRTLPTDPAPIMSYLELSVSNDVGVDEFVPIGHGMIDKTTVRAVGGSTGAGASTSSVGSSAIISRGGGQAGSGKSIKVHVVDLGQAVKRNVWQMPFIVPAGTNYADAARLILQNRLPSQEEFSIASTERVLQTPLVYGLDQGGDPWQDLRELAMAIGFECFFDPRGVFVWQPVPDPRRGEPVFEFNEDLNPIVVEALREFADEQTFNDVVITGQSSGVQNPVSAEAFDNDPASTTYILGKWGRKTQRLTFTNVTTVDQAQDVANAFLYNSIGMADTVTITCVPNPALEPGDVIKIKISQVNADGTYMINSMTTPISPAEGQQLVLFRQSTNV